jgi:hypothetical protein
VATLGIVEFVLYLIDEYHPSYDKTRKTVFTDVHFLFFYTAILNAIFSVCTTVLVVRASRKEWIQTESLELNHYVEIRETFSRVEKELDQLRAKSKRRVRRRKTENGSSNAGTAQELGLESSHPNDPERGNLQSLNGSSEKDLWAFQSWDQVWTSVLDQLRYPALNHQYYSLLKQIRFHELRVHIVQSYNLPSQIKISDYLMRSEQVVLMKLVNVSSLAWLLLTTAVCVLYFIFGMVFYKRDNQELIGVALTYIYFFWMASFVVFCWLLSVKMKSIFNSLMHSVELWDIQSSNKEDKERLSQKQLALFWYKQPSLVIKLIEFMQFGYATSLSTLIVFWNEIKDGSVSMVWFLFSLILCYILFVYVTVQAIPRYTLCTSLGQLVHERRLRETVALFRLEEAKQNEAELLDIQITEKNNFDNVVRHDADLSSNKVDNVVVGTEKNGRQKRSRTKRKSISDGVAVMAGVNVPSPGTQGGIKSSDDASLRYSQPAKSQAKEFDRRLQRPFQGDQLAELVKVNTSALRLMIAERNQRESNEQLQFINESSVTDDHVAADANSRGNRHVRKRSLSDGVLFLSDGSSSMSEARSTQLSLQVANTVTPSTAVSAEDKPCSDAAAAAVFRPSEDDCCSVKGDEPFKYSVPAATQDAQTRGFKLMKLLHSYFSSERHIEISNVFGAIVAFFLVGQRVEGFIHSQEIHASRFVSFNFDLEFTFWMLTAWLCMFVLASVLIFFLLRYYVDFQTTKGCRIAIAAGIDLIISVTCLTVLFVSEYERCCMAVSTEGTDQSGRSSFFDPDPTFCDCPRFGTRLYGGLGKIEPYTSLVLLRVLRHLLARKVFDFLQYKYSWPTIETEKDSNRIHKIGAVPSQSSQVLKFGGQSWNAMSSALAVTEVWEATIGSYPDVAAVHGEFSSEILRLMLGVTIPSNEHSGGNDRSELVNDSKESPKDDPALTSGASQMFSLSNQYSSLSTIAQAAILAGKLGRPIIRSTSQVQINCESSQSRPGLVSRGQSVMFEIDKNEPTSIHLHQNAISSVSNQSYNFISPNARLIRSMRRCDRKFLPLLESWTEVDVVVTRFEIVYLDATVDESNDSSTRNGMLQALQATKGGKGLRLCDVVAGRRVAGRVVLSDVSSLHVVRHLPVQESESHLIDSTTGEIGLSEYWKVPPSHTDNISPYSLQSIAEGRSEAWNHFSEDHLTIGTIHGHSLVLRFYADLDDAIRHPEHQTENEKDNGIVFKNNALQWVQTIGRYCGPKQLKQQLSHFGDDSSNELSDYLTIVDRNESRRGLSHRRILSDMQGYSFRIPQSNQALSSRGILRPALIRRSSTQGSYTAGQRGLSRPNIMRRMSAVDAGRSGGQRPPRPELLSDRLPPEDCGT